MGQLRCIIVDDDPLSREVLRKSVSDSEGIVLVGSYHNAFEAKMALSNKDIDVVFLDIEMPEMTGFELIESYANIAQVVIVTSQRKYAFDAFRYDVTDFLSKPVEPQRFQQAMKRVKFYAENLFKAQNEEQQLVIKSDGSLVKIDANKIDYVEAMGDYIKVVLGDKTYVVHSTMKAFMAELPESFLRVHKSYIVNLDRVVEMDDTHLIGEYFNLPVSRSYKNLVKSKFSE
jgi:DNA-binding LytR/AlgR family response regulator